MEPLDLKSLEPENGDWSCVTDGRLLAQLSLLGTNLEARAQQIQDKFDTLDQRVAQSQTKFDNVTNEFLLLSNTQFIENRVYDEADPKVDEDYATGQIKPMIELSDEDKQKIYEANVQKSLEIGLNFVSEAFDHVKIDVSDSEDEVGDVPLLRQPLLEAKNPYHLRRLPYLIGSDSFLNDDFAGVGGSKPKATSAQSDIDVESELSEDDIEPQLPISNRAQPTEIGRPVSRENPGQTDSPALVPKQSTLFDSDSDDDLFHGSSQNQKLDISPPSIPVEPVATPELNFATELARKLKVPPTEELKSDPPSLPTLPKPKKPIVNEPTPSPPQANLRKPDLFGGLGESDSDDLFSSPVVIKTPKKIVVSSKHKNLFGDSSDSGEDDFLFSSKMKPPIPNSLATKPRSQGSSGATTTIATTDRPETSNQEEGVREEEEEAENVPNHLAATSSSKAHAQDAQDAQGGQGQQSKEKKTKKKGAVQKASLFSDSESDDDDFLLFASKDTGGSLKKDSKRLFELSDEATSETETMSEIRPKKPIGGVAMFSPGVDILGALNKRNSAGKTDLAHQVKEEDTMDGNAPSSGKKAIKTVIKKVKRTKTKNNNNNNNNNAADSTESDSLEEEANENTDDEVYTVASFEVDPPPKALDVSTAVKQGPPVALKPSFKAFTEQPKPSTNSGEDSSSNSSSPKPSRNEIKSPPPVAPKPVSRPLGEPQTSSPPPSIAPKPMLSAATIEEKARILAQLSPTLEQRPNQQNELTKYGAEPPLVAPKVDLNSEPNHLKEIIEDPLNLNKVDPLKVSSSIRLEPESNSLSVVKPEVVMEIKRSPTMSEDELSSKESQSPHEGSPKSSINRPGGTVSKSAFRSSLEKALIKGPMSPKTPPISPSKKFDDEVVFRNPDESDVKEESGPRVSDPPSDGEVSFTGHLLVGATKVRAKGSVKRRPPTRRSRLFDALPINEASDMEDAVDSVLPEAPKEAKADISSDQPEVLSDKTEEKSNSPTNSDTVQSDGDGTIIDEERPFSPDDPLKKPPPMPAAVKATNHSIFDTSSDDDDLFAQPTPSKLSLPKSEAKLFGSDSSSDDDLFKK
ncbi:hypothetical protein TCAL_02300 [Tigriopus californicus]|uniref:FAM21/CAPZIP domain-containing protein n=1 Tax=Tigriopus californicus TaxID=6832 RepID=A0A553NQ36_TIGCA|nr:WASH complex subunit 2C-like [Tigriopus californicus]TRY67561.1 hypothetical protein TCAL_02300 [Tigriopus californicus]|eukprot:TCALIF_02300-PA protein Name:"Similar to Fam21 WASH complex subunit FAM21 (Rattus norvegicus)" AED:0.12 eAED:0.12 QI:510/1/0.75/1/1/0.75/4/0/1082